MNKEIVFKVNTKVLKDAIDDKFGGVPNFAAQTKYNEKSIYNWLKNGEPKSPVLFEMAEVLGIEDLNKLIRKEVITWQD